MAFPTYKIEPDSRGYYLVYRDGLLYQRNIWTMWGAKRVVNKAKKLDRWNLSQEGLI